MTAKELIKTISFIEILKGMALTLKRMFSHAVTIQYPTERRPIAPGLQRRACPGKKSGGQG